MDTKWQLVYRDSADNLHMYSRSVASARRARFYGVQRSSRAVITRARMRACSGHVQVFSHSIVPHFEMLFTLHIPVHFCHSEYQSMSKSIN